MSDDLSPNQLAELYTAGPGDFLAVRTRIVSEAKQAGDAELARTVGALRKPTTAAWIVNRQVQQNPSIVERLLSLGDRLRAAHEDLDAGVLRELSAARRQLVTEVTADALADAGRADAGAALRDEVADTIDAAVADPQIAARLGRLARAEKWSGFGVAAESPAGTPGLTVLRGGRGAGPAAGKTRGSEPTEPRATPPKVDPAARRRARRARDTARENLGRADSALHQAEEAQCSAAEQIQDLTAQLAQTQAALDTAEREHDRSRQEVRSARTRRREAQAALDRAERRAP